MKFWELTSVMRGETDALQAVLRDPRWRQYDQWYSRLAQYVNAQDRAVLDAEVPDELCRSALARSSVKYYVEEEWLRMAVPGKPLPKNCQQLTALEAFGRAVGSALEEVQEYGSFKILRS